MKRTVNLRFMLSDLLIDFKDDLKNKYCLRELNAVMRREYLSTGVLKENCFDSSLSPPIRIIDKFKSKLKFIKSAL